jgi:hypothetical protein
MTTTMQRFVACIAAVAFYSLSIDTAFALVAVSDSFDRANSTDLGATDVGGVSWTERHTNGGGFSEAAVIVDGKLRIDGAASIGSQPPGSNPGQAILQTTFADFDVSVDLSFGGLTNPTLSSTYNAAGFMLRKPGTDQGILGTTFGAANGQIDAQMYPGGGFLIRQNSSGNLTTLYATSPFDSLVTSSTLNVFADAGTLPAMIGGMPFDVDQDGVLEDDEPFKLGAVVVGNSLMMKINGVSMVNLTLLASAPATSTSFVALLKNRHTSGGTRESFSPLFDNFTIMGAEPPPPPPIIHVGANNPAVDESWTSQVGSPIAHSGPVDDGGIAAWNLDDNANSRQAFTRSLTDDQLAQVAVNGFRYRATMRVVDANDAPDGAIEMGVFLDSNLGFSLAFGSDASGNALVHTVLGTVGGSSLELSAPVVLSPGYHDYLMAYEPATNTVDIYTDGVLAFDDYAGFTISSSLNRILWGSNATLASGESNWSYVEFQVVPEPSSAMLSACIAAVVAAWRRKSWRRIIASGATSELDDVLQLSDNQFDRSARAVWSQSR